MKKIMILAFVVLLTGCGINIHQKDYNLYLDQLKDSRVASTNFPYDINVSFDKLTSDEVVYQIVIDNSTDTLNNIKVLVYHNQTTNDVFPSLGLFDGNYNLITSNINEDSSNIRGINLVGYIPFKGKIEDFKPTIKVLVMYDLNSQTKKDYHIFKY